MGSQTSDAEDSWSVSIDTEDDIAEQLEVLNLLLDDPNVEEMFVQTDQGLKQVEEDDSRRITLQPISDDTTLYHECVHYSDTEVLIPPKTAEDDAEDKHFAEYLVINPSNPRHDTRIPYVMGVPYHGIPSMVLIAFGCISIPLYQRWNSDKQDWSYYIIYPRCVPFPKDIGKSITTGWATLPMVSHILFQSMNLVKSFKSFRSADYFMHATGFAPRKAKVPLGLSARDCYFQNFALKSKPTKMMRTLSSRQAYKLDCYEHHKARFTNDDNSELNLSYYIIKVPDGFGIICIPDPQISIPVDHNILTCTKNELLSVPLELRSYIVAAGASVLE